MCLKLKDQAPSFGSDVTRELHGIFKAESDGTWEIKSDGIAVSSFLILECLELPALAKPYLLAVIAGLTIILILSPHRLDRERGPDNVSSPSEGVSLHPVSCSLRQVCPSALEAKPSQHHQSHLGIVSMRLNLQMIFAGSTRESSRIALSTRVAITCSLS